MSYDVIIVSMVSNIIKHITLVKHKLHWGLPTAGQRAAVKNATIFLLPEHICPTTRKHLTAEHIKPYTMLLFILFSTHELPNPSERNTYAGHSDKSTKPLYFVRFFRHLKTETTLHPKGHNTLFIMYCYKEAKQLHNASTSLCTTHRYMCHHSSFKQFHDTTPL